MEKLPQKIRARLDAALSSARMENANFAFRHDYVISCDETGKPFEDSEPEQVDAYVKEKVRLYLGTWVASPIVRVLEWSRGE